MKVSNSARSSHWTLVEIQDGSGWQFQIPEVTAKAQTIEITRDTHKGMIRVHAHTPDLYELYFEVVSYPERLDHQELIEKQKPFIEKKFTNVRFSEVNTSTFKKFQTAEFTFESDEKTRRFIYIKDATRSYRVILNPLSNLNVDVLNSLEPR
jgi:hypothetical protein